MSIAIVIPTYNEIDNIANLIDQILALPVEAHIVIVDDNSPDGTGQLIDRIAAAEPRVHPVHRPAKLGLGTAHIAGMRHAFALDCDPIATMDADFSHDPSYLPAMLEQLSGCDVVIGSRYVQGGGMQGRNLKLRLVSWGANVYARSMLGIKAHDCTSGYRVYRRRVLESLNLDEVFSNGYSFLIEMLFLCQSHDWRISEVPIEYTDRRTGTSKISRTEIYRATYTVLRLTGRRWRAATLKRATINPPDSY